MHAGVSGDDGGQKRNVLIVSALLRIAIDLALRSKTHRRVEILGVGEVHILLNVDT